MTTVPLSHLRSITVIPYDHHIPSQCSNFLSHLTGVVFVCFYSCLNLDPTNLVQHRGWLTGRSHIYRFSPPSLFFPHNLPLMRMSRLFCGTCHSLDFAHRPPEVSPVYVSVPCMPVVVRSGVSAGFRISVFLLVSFIGGMWTSVRGFLRLGCLPVGLTLTGFRCGSL